MIRLSAFDITPNDSLLTNDILVFLKQTFIADNIVFLKETNKTYTSSQVTELAEDIIKQHESINKLNNKEGGEK